MSFEIAPNGSWLCDDISPHYFDGSLMLGITTLLAAHRCRTVIDFGCGSGAYVEALYLKGFEARGYDGNPNTHKFHRLCTVADLSQPISVGRADWVLSLETGEHISKSCEQTFIDNLTRHAQDGIILSWFPREGHGIGHCNPQPNQYVKNALLERGWRSLEPEQEMLRKLVWHVCWWFAESLMVFKRA